jgi:hypothetical protein
VRIVRLGFTEYVHGMLGSIKSPCRVYIAYIDRLNVCKCTEHGGSNVTSTSTNLTFIFY